MKIQDECCQFNGLTLRGKQLKSKPFFNSHFVPRHLKMSSPFQAHEFKPVQSQSNLPRFLAFDRDTYYPSTSPLNINTNISNNKGIKPIGDGLKSRNRSNYRFYAKIISYTGGFIQALYITCYYLQFEVTTNVYIRNPGRTELPSVSLCFFYKRNFNRNKDNLTDLTIEEISQDLPNYNSFVQSCNVLDQNYRYIGCLSRNLSPKIITYLSLYTKCFTLFSGIKTPIEYEKSKIGSQSMVEVILNVTQIETRRVGIFLTHTSESLDESLGNPAFLQFDTRDNNLATVTFERTVINKLPAPYSNCRDYSRTECKNKATCVRKCIVKQSYANSKAWEDKRYVPNDEPFNKGRFGLTDESNYTSYCYKKYEAEPCTDYLYNAIMASEFNSPFRDNNSFHINVAYPLGTETKISYVPLQGSVEFICFVTSVISLWTEASMIRISDKFLGLVTKIMIKIVEARKPVNYR